jgi:hypothetical protein
MSSASKPSHIDDILASTSFLSVVIPWHSIFAVIGIAQVILIGHAHLCIQPLSVDNLVKTNRYLPIIVYMDVDQLNHH